MEGEAKNLYKQAKEDMDERDYDKAIDRLNRALEIFRDLGRQKDVTKCAKELEKAYEKQADAINKIADELFKQQKYEEAITYYRQSVELIKETSKKKDQSKYDKELRKSYEKFAQEINKQADQLRKEKNYDEAIELYHKSIDLMKKSYNSDKVNDFMKELGKLAGEYANDLNKQADREFKQKNYKKSLEIYEKSVEVADKSNNAKLIKDMTKDLHKNYETLADNLEESAENLIDEGQLDDAIDKLSNALRFIEKTQDDKKVEKIRKKISKVYEDNAEKINKAGDEAFKRKDYEKAIDIYHSSLEMAKESQNQKMIENYSKELNKSFEKHAEEVNKQGDEAFEAKEYEKAEMIYIKSLSLATESAKDSLINKYSKELRKTQETWAKNIKEAAKQALEDRQYEIAIKNFEESLEIIKRTEDDDEIKEYLEDLQEAYEDWADKLNKRGDNAYDAKNYEQAVELYTKAFDLIEKTEDEGKIKKYRKDRDKAMKKMT